jgi:hypothetical protein
MTAMTNENTEDLNHELTWRLPDNSPPGSVREELQRKSIYTHFD